MRLRSTLIGVLICSVLLAGCTGDADNASEPTTQTPTLIAPADATTVVPGETPADIALRPARRSSPRLPSRCSPTKATLLQEAAAAFAIERDAHAACARAPGDARADWFVDAGAATFIGSDRVCIAGRGSRRDPAPRRDDGRHVRRRGGCRGRVLGDGVTRPAEKRSCRPPSRPSPSNRCSPSRRTRPV